MPVDETLKQRLHDKSAPVTFKKAMGLMASTTLGVGALMGAGLYVLVGIASAQAGPGLPIAYGICGMLTFLSVIMFADLSRRLPISGGGYAYAYNQLGSFWGFMVGWHLAVGSVFACALYAHGFATYSASFLPVRYVSDGLYKVIAGFLVLTFIVMNMRAGKGGDRVQRIFTWGNLAVLVILAAVSVPLISGENFVPVFPRGVGGVGAAISLIYISFFGYQLIANSAEEIKDAQRTVPRAMGISMGIALLFYVIVAVVAVGAVNWKELAISDAPLVLLASKAMGPWGAWLIGVGGILASAAALNSTLSSQGRQIFAMGRDRLLPGLLGSVRGKSGAPAAALLAGAGVTIVVIILADLEFIAKAANFALLFSMLPISVALHRLYRSEEEAGGVRLPLWHKAVPWAAMVANASLLLTLDWQSMMFGGMIVGVGCAVFLSYSYASEKRGRAGFSVDLAAREGHSLAFLRKGERILVPMANPDTLESLFSLSRALLPTDGGEVVALRVVKTTQGKSPREALLSTAGTADALEATEMANQLANVKGVNVRPVVRAANDLADGIIHASIEERVRMIIMGWSSAPGAGPSELVEKIASKVRNDLVFLQLTHDVTPRRIGVALGGQGNLPLMVKVAMTIAEDFQGEVTYLNVVPEQFEMEHLAHSRRIQMAAIERHTSLVPFNTELLRSDNPLDVLVKRSADLDMLVVGTSDSTYMDGAIGAFSAMIAEQAKCSVVIVRRGTTTTLK